MDPENAGRYGLIPCLVAMVNNDLKFGVLSRRENHQIYLFNLKVPPTIYLYPPVLDICHIDI